MLTMLEFKIAWSRKIQTILKYLNEYTGCATNKPRTLYGNIMTDLLRFWSHIDILMERQMDSTS